MRPCHVQPWELFETKMKGADLSKAAIDAFKHNYEQLVAGVTGLVRSPPPPPGALRRLSRRSNRAAHSSQLSHARRRSRRPTSSP